MYMYRVQSWCMYMYNLYLNCESALLHDDSLETRDSFFSRFAALAVFPVLVATSTITLENGTAIRLAKIFRAGKVRSMRTWTVYYKSCRDVNHVFITLVHVYTELVRRYTEHVR